MQLPKLDTILLGNHFVGMELFSVNSEDGVAVLALEKKKNELTIISREKRSTFDQLQVKPGNNTPVFLVINNNQVIHKEIDSTDPIDGKIVHKAFPNIKTEEFFYEIWRLESKSIIAICRKNYIDELLKNLSNSSIAISGISLGVCSISQITGFLDQVPIKTNTQTITLDDETILSPTQDSLVKNYDVSGLDIQNTYLLCFSSILQKIVPSVIVSGNVDTINSNLFDNFYQKSFFKKGIQFMVFTILVIVLVNFFLFYHYYSKSIEANANVLASKDLTDKIKQTKERLKEKESKLKNSTNFFDSKSSLIISQLVKNIPNSILLNELTYHPLEKKIKEDEPIVYQSNIILISGKTINVKELTNWFEEIEKNKWVKSTEIVHFGKNEDNESIFTIQINLKADENKY